MKIRSATLRCSAPDLASCPPSELPEFAFIGRSNVGKSSLVNMLTRVNGLARTSATPGKTQLINIFTINNRWQLADLPGYGYAKTGRSQRSHFSSIISNYLMKRPNLQGTFILIDVRLTPQQIDLEFIHWMIAGGLPFILIFTKADKISAQAAQSNIEAFLSRVTEMSDDTPTVVLSSSKLGTGRNEILTLIANALAEEPEHLQETAA